MTLTVVGYCISKVTFPFFETWMFEWHFFIFCANSDQLISIILLVKVECILNAVYIRLRFTLRDNVYEAYEVHDTGDVWLHRLYWFQHTHSALPIHFCSILCLIFMLLYSISIFVCAWMFFYSTVQRFGFSRIFFF